MFLGKIIAEVIVLRYFYQRVRDLREDSDMTQQEIADYLGTSAQHYGKYELGNAELPFERAIALAKYYNVSLDYIAGLTNNKKGLSQGELPLDKQHLLELISKSDNTTCKEVIEILKALIETLEK